MNLSETNWILGVDTSRKGVSLALFSMDGQREFIRNVEEVRGDVVSSELDTLLADSGEQLSSIGTVVVALGPGSFTGLRTGIAFCQGLCASGGRRLLGLSSLALMRAQWPACAGPAGARVHGRVGVICKARPGFWYVGLDAEGYPSAAFGSKLPEEEFLADAESSDFLKDAAVILADGPRPTDGPLANLHGHWHDLTGQYYWASVRNLLPFITPSMHWNANYLQPSYAEQAKKV